MDGCLHVVEPEAKAVSLHLKGRHGMSATFTCYQRKSRESEMFANIMPTSTHLAVRLSLLQFD